MKKRWFSICVIFVALLIVQPAWSFDLTILHVNDSHSYLDVTKDKLKPGGKSTYVKMGAWARLQTAVNEVRSKEQNVALLHAGDAVQGDLYFMKYGGKPEMEFLNRLAFTAMTLGNHEFDKGPDFLAGFLGYARIPVVSANMNAVTTPALAARVKPYTIAEYGGEKIGIIGLTIKDTAFISKPGMVSFSEEATAARNYVRELEAMGINKIILLTHVGLERDKELAAAVPGVDVIVGGHSHSLLADPDVLGELGKRPDDTYPVVIKGADGSNVYVVSAWKWGRVLGRLDVTFDAAGRIVKADGKPVILLADTFRQKNKEGKKVEMEGAARKDLLAMIKKNPAAEVVAPDGDSQAFLKPFSEGVAAMRNDVIGQATAPLPHIRVPGVDDSGQALPNGSLIAPHVCRAMLDKIRSTAASVDMALQNAGGVRESVERGNITVGTAYTLMPFGNTLTLVDLTGVQIKAALEVGVTRGSGAFPCVGGARFTADMNRPEGSRIVSVEVQGADGSWASLDAAKTYRVVTNSYLASGGDGYAVMKDGGNVYDTGFVNAQAFIEYVQKVKTLSPPAATGVTYIPAR